MKIEELAPAHKHELLRNTEDFIHQIMPLVTKQVWTDPDRIEKAQEVFRKLVAIQARLTGQEPPAFIYNNEGYLYRMYEHFLDLIIRHCSEHNMSEELRQAVSDRRWLRRHDEATFNYHCATGPKNKACDNCTSPIVFFKVGSRVIKDIRNNIREESKL
jgi:hypothetical protein